MPEKELDLSVIRTEIDAVNKEMLALLIKRLRLCKDVADYKKPRGIPVYVPEREQAILNWAESAAGPEFAPYAKEFFEEVMKLGKDYEHGEIDGSKKAAAGLAASTRPDAVNTDRIVLLPLDRDDTAPVLSMMQDEKLVAPLHIAPFTDEEEAAAFIASESRGKDLAFKLILRENAQYAGIMTLKLDPESPGKAMLLVILTENCWNKGYLTELIPTAEKLAAEKLSADSLWGYIPAESEASIRAFTKAGYTLSHLLSLMDGEFKVYSKTLGEKA